MNNYSGNCLYHVMKSQAFSGPSCSNVKMCCSFCNTLNTNVISLGFEPFFRLLRGHVNANLHFVPFIFDKLKTKQLIW